MVGIVQHVKDYWNDIPQNTPVQMVYAAGAGFIVETIFAGNMKHGAAAAAVSALATAIHGLDLSFFKNYLTQGRIQLTFGEEILVRLLQL